MASYKKAMIGAAAGLLLAHCKPSSSSNLASITGVNAAGQQAAMSLVPVRNFSVAALGAGSGDPGVLQATALVKTRLFAVVECTEVANAAGQTIAAADLMTAVESRAAIDDLYLDNQRRLLTSADDNSLAQFGTAANKLVVVPCQLAGTRLLSWPNLQDLETRIAGLPPAVTSQNSLAVQSVYRLAQAVHLSVRGSYPRSAADNFMQNLPGLTAMIAEQQSGATYPAALLQNRIVAADPFYVPPSGNGATCNDADLSKSALPYVAALKGQTYACVPVPSNPGLADYRAGGASGALYEQAKALLTSEIESTHGVVFAGGAGSDPALYALWDMLTSAQPWPASGLATYLTVGSGFAFDQTFAANAAGAVPAPAQLPAMGDVNQPFSPLSLGITGGSRVHPLSRSHAGLAGQRGLLDGGTTSTADGRPGTVGGRIQQLGSEMGASGGAALAKEASGVAASLAIIRRPAQ